MPSRRRLLVQLWIAVLLAAVIRASAQVVLAVRDDPRQVARAQRVDLNHASLLQLATLPGIGRGRARAIVLHRVRHGPFRTLDDLGKVDGIGPTTLAGLRAYLAPLDSVEPRARAFDVPPASVTLPGR